MPITDAQLLAQLPFLETLDFDQRARALVGLNEIVTQLNGWWRDRDPTIGSIGIVLVGEEGVAAAITTKQKCLELAKAHNVRQEELDAIVSPAPEGFFDVLLVAGDYEVVFGLPVKVTFAPGPGSENN